MRKEFKKKLNKFISNPKSVVSYLGSKGFLNWMPDETYLKLRYYAIFEKKLDIRNPQTFNEKLQWLKLYDRSTSYTNLVDKYEVRKYISKTIGEEYLIPLIGVWDNFDDIDFSILPNEFVLKCTHDSGGVVICTDKSKFDIEEAKRKINKCLRRNFYYSGREFPYKNIKPKIICEKYLTEDSGTELKDYKFLCFNGKVKTLFVCSNRNSKNGLKIDFYDTDWKLMPFERHYPSSGIKIDKPKNYDKMIELSEKLSKDISFLRVDFYEVNSKLYFGELTFYPGSGFEEFTPESYDLLLGSWIKLNNKIK